MLCCLLRLSRWKNPIKSDRIKITGHDSTIYHWWITGVVCWWSITHQTFDYIHGNSLSRSGPFGSCQIHGSMPMPQSESDDLSNIPDIDSAGIKSPINNPGFSHSKCPPEIHRSCFCVRFIAEHTKLLEDSTKVNEMEHIDWGKYKVKRKNK